MIIIIIVDDHVDAFVLVDSTWHWDVCFWVEFNRIDESESGFGFP